MTPKITNVHFVEKYKLHIYFNDGSNGEINLEHELSGEIFEPLIDISFFKQFYIHPELHTISWPNGADFAPEFLYDSLKIPA